MTPVRLGSTFLMLMGATIIVALFMCVGKAWAQDIAVQSPDGGLRIEGRLLGYDGRHIRLQTEHGPLTINYAAIECSGRSCPDPELDGPIVRFSGSARVAQVILPALTQGFIRDRGYVSETVSGEDGDIAYIIRNRDGHGMITLIYHPTTTTDGIADLLAGEVDVLISARSLTPAELELAENAGLGTLASPHQMHLLALDGLVPVVSPGLAVRHLSLSDVADAMSGRVSNWREFGGPDLPIRLHLQDLQNGQAQAFVSRIVQTDGRRLSGDVTFHATSEELADAVASERSGLGIASITEVGNTLPIALQEGCGVHFQPSTTAIKTEDYPLTQPFYLYLPRRYQAPELLSFLRWLSDAEADLILRRAGVETQEPIPIAIQNQGERLAMAIASAGDDVSLEALQSMVDTFQDHARLSLTFRFDEGERQLDLTSRLHARYLATAIQEGRYAGRTLRLVGFSDGEGGAFVNRELSRARAETVKAEVLALLEDGLPPDVSLETFGLGEVLPIGCDDTPWGRQSNRRVELWTGPLQ